MGTGPGELYCHVRPEVAKFVHSLLRTAPPPDLIHDATVAVVLSIEGFRHECAFSTWVYAVVARHVRKWIRTEQRNRELMRAVGEMLPLATPLQPDDVALLRRRVGRVRRALGTLSVRQRICLEQIYFEAEPVHALAKRFGISPEAVRMTVHRARQELRRRLAEDESH